MNRILKLIGATAALGLVAACTTIPGESKPEAISSYAPQPDLDNVPVPEPDQPSDLLLRDFLTASAHPTANHQAAKEFLTEEAAANWEEDTPIVVLERTDVTSAGASAGDVISYDVSGNMVGRLSEAGEYYPESTPFEGEYRLRQVDGQWRIAELPNAVVIDRSDFLQQYTSRNIYYMNQNGDSLVPDPRWIYNEANSLPTTLMSRLTDGPNSRLVGGVRNILPNGVTAHVRPSSGGGVTVDLLGWEEVEDANWEMLVAQIVWTLAGSDVRGPYTVLADGSNPTGQMSDGWQIQDVSQFDPEKFIAEPLRAVSNGKVYEEEGAEAAQMDGWTSRRWVESMAVSSQDGVFGAVTGRGEEPRQLMVGELTDSPQMSLQARSITRPSWGADSSVFYAVADGQDPYRFTRNVATGAIGRSEVDASAIEDLGMDDPRISVFRVSHSGTRVLMVINGRVFVSVLEQGDGQQNYRLGTLREISYPLGDSAVSADWRSDGSILVGTRSSDAPVWQLSLDGAVATQLSTRNISAPVVAVAASGNRIYATDSRALMQFDPSTENARFWREVPSMQGQRAVPVLTY